MRRKNRPRVVWIPNTPENSVDSAGASTWSILSLAITAATGGGPSFTAELPLVLDGSQSSANTAGNTLADIESSGYRLRRVVGQVFVFMAQSGQVDTEQLYGVSVGLMVRRTGNTGGGSFAAGSTTAAISPDDIDNSMDPWIFKRSWILSDGPISTSLSGGLSNGYFDTRSGRGPTTNYGQNASSLRDGPFIDQKTARIVGPEERLFLDVSATPLIISGTTTTSVVLFTNLRVLGSMRQNIGNRRNASR